MRVTLFGMVLLMVVGCGETAPQKPPVSNAGSVPAELPIPLDLRDQIEKSVAIGRQLYLLDKVSAVGTDVLLEQVKDARNKGLGGYLPMREGDDNGNLKDSWMVAFFTDETPPRIAYEIRVGINTEPSLQAFDPPKASPKMFVSLVAARQRAIAALPPTDQPINPLVLPGEINGEKGILVYLLAGTTKPNVAVFGKHFRSLVPVDGVGITYMMPLSNSSLEVATRGPNGEEPAALVVSQIVTDYPLETHVFTSLLVKKQVYVGTRRGVWRVDGDKIAFISDVPPKGMQ